MTPPRTVEPRQRYRSQVNGDVYRVESTHGAWARIKNERSRNTHNAERKSLLDERLYSLVTEAP